MDPKSQEELETWLEEVELAKQEIESMTKGDQSVEEIDRKIARREARKKREQETEDRKRQEAIEKQKLGRFGKGHKQNYSDFCRHCFREYELPTPECLHCGKQTQSMQSRREYLLKKVDEYQTTKTKKKERQVKWDLWKKTQSMLWKKTSTNYSKWDYFTSSSEEEKEDEEPIVPENDPQFQAMEADMKKRQKDRKEKRIKAEECKIKGNDYMQKGDYEKAVLWYSEGLDLIKDYKPLWTNRALAWIKMGYYKKAIKDCSRVLEFCECFEDGYTKSKDFASKAFLRRALARKERKEFREALEDVEESLTLFPKDSKALSLKEEIVASIEHQKKAQQLQQDKLKLEKKEQEILNKNKPKQKENPEDDSQQKQNKENQEKNNNDQKKEEEKQKEEETQDQDQNQEKQDKPELNSEEAQKKLDEQFDKKEESSMEYQFNEAENIQKSYMKLVDLFMEKENKQIQQIEMEILKYMLTDLQESKIYFFEKKGLQKLLSMIQNYEENPLAPVYLIVDIFVRDNIIFQKKFIDEKGVTILSERIQKLLKDGSKNSENYDQVDQMLEILVTLSASDKSRDTLKDSQEIIDLIENTRQNIIINYKNEVPMVSNWLKFLGNMCYQNSKVKVNVISKLETYISSLYPIFALDKMRTKYELLRDNGYAVFANLLTDQAVRDKFAQGQFNDIIEQILLRISSYDLNKNPKLVNVASSSLTVLVNASFKATPEAKAILKDLKVGEIILNRFQKLDYKNAQYRDLFFRLLQTLASLDYRESQLLDRQIYIFAVRFFDDYSITTGYTNHAIRILASVFGAKENEIWISKNIKDEYYDLLVFQMKKMLNSDDEMRFSNACTLSGMLSLLKPQLINPKFNDVIERLIYICSNKVGNMRKTAAHLLGKISKDPQNLQKLRDLHGIQILHSILSSVV